MDFSSSMGESVENLLQRPPRVEAKSMIRRIKVIQGDTEKMASIEEMLSGSNDDKEEDLTFDSETRNISPSLVMTSLKDRIFMAEVAKCYFSLSILCNINFLHQHIYQL